MARILVNLITLQDEKINFAWLKILKKFQSLGNTILINTGIFAKEISKIGDTYEYKWLDIEEKRMLMKNPARTKWDFSSLSLKRNYLAIKSSNKISGYNNFNIIYTPSSVLDLVIYPFYLKITRKKIKWATTLANVVPFADDGNKLVRLLAWIFFQTSLQMIKKADVVFASTTEVREYLIKKGFDKNKVVETNFAVENEMIKEAEPVAGLKIDALFCGRINETKGIYDMLEVLNIIKKKYLNFQLAIMGGGDETTKKQFKQKIKQMNLENNVQFLGFKTGMEKYNIIKSAKCFWFLSKSRSESFGIALLEAVCSGIPAFAYDLPQFSRLYPNGEVNISPMGDYNLVAEKVKKLFEEGNFSNEKGKLLLGKYSWEKIAEMEYNEIKKL